MEIPGDWDGSAAKPGAGPIAAMRWHPLREPFASAIPSL